VTKLRVDLFESLLTNQRVRPAVFAQTNYPIGINTWSHVGKFLESLPAMSWSIRVRGCPTATASFNMKRPTVCRLSFFGVPEIQMKYVVMHKRLSPFRGTVSHQSGRSRNLFRTVAHRSATRSPACET
jgi:hypothetical protein